MTKSDKLLIEEYVKKTSMTKSEAKVLRTLVRKYIDPSCDICFTCPAAIRFAWVRLSEWWKLQNQDNYRFIKQKV